MDLKFPKTAKLRDGTPIVIRPVGPQDRELLQDGFAHLSDTSRYMRFFKTHPRLTDAELDTFTEANDSRHTAIGALSGDTPMGIARYILLEDGRSAEIALTIIDYYQNCGLGTLLLDTLIVLARAAELREFTAIVHARNSGMRSLLSKYDAQITATYGAEIEFRFDLQQAALT